MKVGIVGFAGSGKSTVFELLTGVTPDRGAVRSGQVGVAQVADPRLDFLAELYRPKKVTRATIEFADTPGLSPTEHADNPQRLGIIRESHGLLIVLGAYAGGDPGAELERFRDELLFADLTIVSGRAERLQSQIGKPRPDREALQAELALVEHVRAELEAGRRVAEMALAPDQMRLLRSVRLLTEMPELVLVNVAEDALAAGVPEAVREKAPAAIAVSARLELELGQLGPEERQTFMDDLGVTSLARDRIITAAYAAMGQISYLTAGEKEVRAWTVARGSDAVSAAGEIHTDLARGFIRAEVVAYDDLRRLGSMREVKAKGLHRLEGKTYIVQDGDVIEFRSGI